MFIRFTPVKPQKNSATQPEDEDEILILAQFTRTPKLSFESVEVGETATRRLLIKNPSQNIINMHIIHDIQIDMRVSLSFLQVTLDKGAEALLEITWTPVVEVAQRNNLIFKYFGSLSKVVPIAFKSVVKALRTKTKNNANKSSRSQRSSKRSKKPSINPIESSPVNKYSFSGGKENKEPLNFLLDSPAADHRRQTYVLKKAAYFDSLENIQQSISPLHNKPKSPLDENSLLDVSLNTYLRINLGDKNRTGSPINENYLSPTSITTENKNLDMKYGRNISSLFPTMECTYYEKETTAQKDIILNKACRINNEVDIADLESFQCQLDQMSESKRRSNLSNMQDQENHCEPDKGLKKTSNVMSWSRTGGRAASVGKWSSGLSFPKNIPSETSPGLTISKTGASFLVIHNPFLSFIDPFMTKDLRIDEEWVCEQEMNFKMWLNKLLSPPLELTTEPQNVDVVKIWRECTSRAETVTQDDVLTKVPISKNLLKIQEALREIYLSTQVSSVLNKVYESVALEKISIREDRAIHLNVGIRQDILKLLLSYHPLWLRIGMEIIFSKKIQLKSDDDSVELSRFIMSNFLGDDKLLKRHKTAHAPKYKSDLNKHFLNHYFSLVLLLDKAKTNKIGPHDPCLFSKDSAIKESREMLLYLSRSLISSVGDITKVLKSYGYNVTHVQTYIHEFDPRVENIGVDLRDGVRLTKVAELISKRDDLTDQLRVPAISRLQKIHNVQLVFHALAEAGYDILYGVSPRDIVDGHKEKTLSFLWQIIYKFEASLMLEKATTIQNWYRSLSVFLKKRKLKRERSQKENAAILIQRWYRRLKFSQKLYEASYIVTTILYNQRTEMAAMKIQSYFKMYRCRITYFNKVRYLKALQCRCKGWLFRNKRIDQIKLVKKLVNEVKEIQKRYEKDKFIQRVIFVQRQFRANRIHKIERNRFLLLQATTICLQKHFRSRQKMIRERHNYIQLQNACSIIQQKFKALQIMIRQRIAYSKLKCTVIFLQRRLRANKARTIERNRYLKIQKAIIKVQQRLRDFQDMRKQRRFFMQLKHNAIYIQRRFRANRCMTVERNRYLQIQVACRTIQHRFRGLQKMKIDRMLFIRLKDVTLLIQRRFRANKAMVAKRMRFLQLQTACKIVQERLRAMQRMKKEIMFYTEMKSSTILIQRRFRANKCMTADRNRYLQLQKVCRRVQQRFRARQLMRNEKLLYTKLKNATILIQKRFRANKAMTIDRNRYLLLKITSEIIQQKVKASISMRAQRKSFLKLREATICIQSHFRANKQMLFERNRYYELRNATILIQRKFRDVMYEQNSIIKKGKAAMQIQAAWRGYKCRALTSNECKAIRKRIEFANVNAASTETLGERGRNALDTILRNNSSILILCKALEDLALTTRRSREICYEFSRTVTTSLYFLLSATGRSLPETVVNILSLDILINFYKYEKSRQYSFIPTGIEAVITLMMNFCDKDSAVFPTACTLLWLFGHNKEWKKRIRNFDVKYKISKIESLLSRKIIMVSKSRMTASLVFSKSKNLYLPYMLPDWGLDLEKKPFKFQNSLYAFKCLRKILEV